MGWREPSLEDWLMRLLRGSIRATHILDDDELASDATRLRDERGASVRRQMVEEMAGEDPVELAVAERQRCDISLEHTRVRHTGRSNLDHPSALVERHQLASQMLVRKPVPHATSSTRAGGKARTTPMSCSTSADQPGRSRSANDPVPSHQPSYSAARWSKCARI